MKIKNITPPTTSKEVPVKLRVGKKKVQIHVVSLAGVILAFEYKQHSVKVIRGDTLGALKQLEKKIKI